MGCNKCFLDKPIWGYGSWAADPGMKYHLMIANLTRADFHGNIDAFYMIPGHSVILEKVRIMAYLLW